MVTSMAVKTATGEPLYPITVDAFERMIAAGVFGDDDVRVELLDGVLVEMPEEQPPHALLIARMAEWLIRNLPSDDLLVRVGAPMIYRPLSVPCPDFTVVDRAAATWTQHPADAHLVVEVSDATRSKDRGRKSRIYAREGIREYWIVDVEHRCVEVRSQPAGEQFDHIRIVRPPDPVQCGTVALPPLDLDALFAA